MAHCLIITVARFNGNELWPLLGMLHKREHTFDIVSTRRIIKDERTLKPHRVTRTVYEVSKEEATSYDGIVVVSGNPQDTKAYWTDKYVINLIKASKGVLGAICCAVPTLAPAAKDAKLSAYPLLEVQRILRRHGAIHVPVSLMVDRRFVTAENEFMTRMWAEEICNVLEGKPPQYNLTETKHRAKGGERRMMPEVRAAIDAAKADD